MWGRYETNNVVLSSFNSEQQNWFKSLSYYTLVKIVYGKYIFRLINIFCMSQYISIVLLFLYYYSCFVNPLASKDLQRRRAVSPLKIKIPSKNMHEKQQIHQLFIQFINYVWYLLHVSALHCHPQGAFLVSSERCSIEEQSTEYCGWACCV
jgi:hypothetical protein